MSQVPARTCSPASTPRQPRDTFIESVGSRLLAFEAIDVAERATRRYGDVAVVVGRSRMAGGLDGAVFEVASRYTHVLTRSHGGGWRLVSAQGTRIADQPTPRARSGEAG